MILNKNTAKDRTSTLLNSTPSTILPLLSISCGGQSRSFETKREDERVKKKKRRGKWMKEMRAGANCAKGRRGMPSEVGAKAGGTWEGLQRGLGGVKTGLR